MNTGTISLAADVASKLNNLNAKGVFEVLDEYADLLRGSLFVAYLVHYCDDQTQPIVLTYMERKID
tara:strand:- start:1463 stop:1660 length:198 start_codon:yes stop_codon:yes gene_type:complete